MTDEPTVEDMARRLVAVETLAYRLVAAGPFYAGDEDELCAVCHGLVLHRDNCSYVGLARLLRVPEDEIE